MFIHLLFTTTHKLLQRYNFDSTFFHTNTFIIKIIIVNLNSIIITLLNIQFIDQMNKRMIQTTFATISTTTSLRQLLITYRTGTHLLRRTLQHRRDNFTSYVIIMQQHSVIFIRNIQHIKLITSRYLFTLLHIRITCLVQTDYAQLHSSISKLNTNGSQLPINTRLHLLQELHTKY